MSQYHMYNPYSLRCTQGYPPHIPRQPLPATPTVCGAGMANTSYLTLTLRSPYRSLHLSSSSAGTPYQPILQGAGPDPSDLSPSHVLRINVAAQGWCPGGCRGWSRLVCSLEQTGVLAGADWCACRSNSLIKSRVQNNRI